MRCLRFVLILGLVLGLLASAGLCAKDADVSVYSGNDPSQDGISLTGWGSGTAAKSNERVLDGAWAIKISTQGLYAGGKVQFEQPVTLFSGGAKPDRYLQFAFFFKETRVVNPASTAEYAMSDVEPYTQPKASKMRFVFVSDTGEMVEAVEPTGPVDPDDNWMRIAVPMSKFKGKEEFKMKSLLVFTDIPSTVYLGSAKLTTDDTPIKVEPIDPRTTSVFYTEYFVAKATGGVSSLLYSWDFDSNNGIQADSTDLIAKYAYRTGGEFTVTLTVRDADGIKEPVTVSAVMSVTD